MPPDNTETELAENDPASHKTGETFRILNWIGIVNQLSVTRANQLLDAGPVPFPQFKMLLHFYHQDDRAHTVSQVAEAFQQPQPGTTKTIQKLEQKGYLGSTVHPRDGRVRLFSITPAGREAVETSKRIMNPYLDELFQDWQPEDLDRLFVLLDRLKRQLDEDRN